MASKYSSTNFESDYEFSARSTRAHLISHDHFRPAILALSGFICHRLYIFFISLPLFRQFSFIATLLCETFCDEQKLFSGFSCVDLTLDVFTCPIFYGDRVISLIRIDPRRRRRRRRAAEASLRYVMRIWIDASSTAIDYDSQLLSMALSTRTCRAASPIIVVRLNAVCRSHDRFVHAFRETRL